MKFDQFYQVNLKNITLNSTISQSVTKFIYITLLKLIILNFIYSRLISNGFDGEE